MSEIQLEEPLIQNHSYSTPSSSLLSNELISQREFIYQKPNDCYPYQVQPFLIPDQTRNTTILEQQQCPPINLNINNNFYQNLEQMMFSDGSHDDTSSNLNMLGNNGSILSSKKDQNGMNLRKQSSLKFDRKQNSSQNYDTSLFVLRKNESEESTVCKQNDLNDYYGLGCGSASTTSARSSGLLSNQQSFSSAISTPFSKTNSTHRNSTSFMSAQDTNIGFERFIPSRKNSKMHINFQSKESLEHSLLFKNNSKGDSSTTNSSQSQSGNNNNNNNNSSSNNNNGNSINNKNENSSISIASLYQKHILDTSENEKILSFTGNKNNTFGSASSSAINQGTFTSKTGLYSQQQMMEQENISDEDFYKSSGYNPQQMKNKKKQQLVITESSKILDAPGLEDDYYLNLLDWSAQNVIGIVLKNEVFGYNFSTRKIFTLQKPDQDNSYKFTSVKFSKSGHLLAIGDSLGGVQVIDAETRKEVTFFQNHEDRVASLSWIDDDILASGSKDRNIYCQDIRDKAIVRKYTGHRNEVCGLQWSCDQQSLASGGNDDKLFVWNLGYNQHQYKFSQHKAAVKAIAWSPHQHGLLVSGGGSRDKTIRFWNIHTGKQIESIETNSQVCSLAFTKNSNQFVSTHGYADNEIYVWKYPTPQKVKIFQGHQQRVIYMALSPDQKQIVTGASDETLRFWDAFPDAPSYKGPESTLKFSDLR